FQAEDGIRDRNVTGVQTCALPISTSEDGASEPAAFRLARWANRLFRDMSGKSAKEKTVQIQRRDELLQEIGRAALSAGVQGPEEIGRASCRERVEGGGGGVRLQTR